MNEPVGPTGPMIPPEAEPPGPYDVDPERQREAVASGWFSFGVADPSAGCGGCRFWKGRFGADDREIHVGECHRRAPVVTGPHWMQAETYGHPVDHSHKTWPTTWANDWCGDWIARAPTIPEGGPHAHEDDVC